MPQPARESDARRWFAIAQADWQHWSEQRVVQGDVNATPRQALPQGRSPSYRKTNDELLHLLAQDAESIEALSDGRYRGRCDRDTRRQSTRNLDTGCILPDARRQADRPRYRGVSCVSQACQQPHQPLCQPPCSYWPSTLRTILAIPGQPFGTAALHTDTECARCHRSTACHLLKRSYLQEIQGIF